MYIRAKLTSVGKRKLFPTVSLICTDILLMLLQLTLQKAQ